MRGYVDNRANAYVVESDLRRTYIVKSVATKLSIAESTVVGPKSCPARGMGEVDNPEISKPTRLDLSYRAEG